MFAIYLYKEGMLGLSEASKLAGQSLEGFMEELGALGIPVVHYSEQDLETELVPFLLDKNNTTKKQ